MKKILKSKIFLFAVALILFIYFNNSSLFTEQRSDRPFLLAHRGLAQTFPMEGITDETCTAERIYSPEHPYLENTIPAIKAAFDAGADMVELDIHPTKDNQFVVFHDWTLDCRTNGRGVTRDHTLAELKKLDIGYGYTADNGKTYPFRGKGVGLMPSLTEVLNAFPDRSLLIHVKSDDPQEGKLLAAFLSKLSQERRSQLAIYGGDEPIDVLKAKLPDLRVMSKTTIKRCLIPYMAIGWTGYMPEACENTQLHIPEKIAPWLWGWPAKFQNRMDQANTRIIVVGGDGSGFSSGFDSPEDIKRLPDDYRGGIWTNRVDKIAPLYEKEKN